MKILKAIGGTLLCLVLLAAILYPFRRDPIGMLAGRQLTGPEAAYPESWDFSDAFQTIAVEVRPDDPHSVTTICFVHEGALYVPSLNAPEKEWPAMVVADARVRLKIGGKVYPASARREEPDDRTPYLESAAKKYPQLADRVDPPPPDLWLFRIGPRRGPGGGG